MTIEFVNESDIQKIYDISKCYFDWTYDNFVSGLKSNNIFLKAVSEEKIVGFLIADDLIDSYNLLLIAVREEFKNQNIATKLIKKLENIAKNKNIEKIWLEVKRKIWKIFVTKMILQIFICAEITIKAAKML